MAETGLNTHTPGVSHNPTKELKCNCRNWVPTLDKHSACVNLQSGTINKRRPILVALSLISGVSVLTLLIVQQKIHCVQAKDKRKGKASHLTDKRSDEGLTLKTSTFLLFTVDNFGTFFFNSVVNTKLAIISAHSESYLREQQVGALKSKDNVEPFYNIHLEPVELKLYQC